MNALSRTLHIVVWLGLSLLVPTFAFAQGKTERNSGKSEAPLTLHADAEFDPTAYAFDGYSLHVGIGTRKLRVDLGCFAMDLPQFVHGNRDFSVSFGGFGTKLQYFVWSEQRGLFVGADVGVVRMTVARDHTDLATEQRQITAGVNAGYRFVLPASFYVSLWLGVAYAFGAEDIKLGDATYEVNPVMIFPAVHVGYRFL